MGTFADKFQGKAQEIILKFSGELGKGKLVNVTGQSYDETTGKYTPTLDEQECYIAFDELTRDQIVSGQGAEYLKDTMAALIAGLDVVAPPKEGDYVQRPGSSDLHKIIFVGTDQYAALYTCHITRKVEEPVVP